MSQNQLSVSKQPLQNPFSSDISIKNNFQQSGVDSQINNSSKLQNSSLRINDQASDFNENNFNNMEFQIKEEGNNSFYNSNNNNNNNSFLRDSNLSDKFRFSVQKDDQRGSQIQQQQNDFPSFGRDSDIRNKFMGDNSQFSLGNKSGCFNNGGGMESDIKGKSNFTLNGSKMSEEMRLSLNRNNEKNFSSQIEASGGEIRMPSDFQTFENNQSRMASNFSAHSNMQPRPYESNGQEDLSKPKMPIDYANENNNQQFDDDLQQYDHLAKPIIPGVRQASNLKSEHNDDEMEQNSQLLMSKLKISHQDQEEMENVSSLQNSNNPYSQQQFDEDNKQSNLEQTKIRSSGQMSQEYYRDSNNLLNNNNNTFQIPQNNAFGNNFYHENNQQQMMENNRMSSKKFNDEYRQISQDRQISGDISHFQKFDNNQEGPVDVGSVFQQFDQTQTQALKSEIINKPNVYYPKEFQVKNEQRDSNQSTKSKGMFQQYDADNRDSLGQLYSQIQKDKISQNFDFNQKLQDQGRQSIQPGQSRPISIQSQAGNNNNNGGFYGMEQFQQSQQQQMNNRNSTQNRGTLGNNRISTESLGRPSFNRPSHISQQSGRLSFDTVDFAKSNRSSMQLKNIKEEDSYDDAKYKQQQQHSQPISVQQPILGCTCTKSKCLKLYCDCFKNQRHCGPTCRCIDCHNNPDHQHDIDQSQLQIKARNPAAFDDLFQAPVNNKNIFNNTLLSQQQQFSQNMLQSSQVIQSTDQQNVQTVGYKKGCNCRKTQCLKKYCECYNAGFKCHSLCKCDDCHNKEIDFEAIENENESRRQQSLLEEEKEYCRQKKFQQLSIFQQQQIQQKQEKVQLVGKGIID